jgi:3-dehydroquinate synthase
MDFGIAHGDAIAIGMHMEARVGERAGITHAGTAVAIAQVLSRLGLPTELPASVDPLRVSAACRRDKKNRASRVVMALPERIGVMARTELGYGATVAEELVAAELGAST